MSAYGGFNEFDHLNGAIREGLVKFASGLFVVICAVALFVTVGLPGALSDVFSSAAFFDSLQISLVWDQNTTPVGILGAIANRFPSPNGVPVSIEGTSLGLGLTLIQILAGFGAAMAGPWLPNEDVSFLTLIIRSLRGDVDAGDVNWQKVGMFSAMLLVATVDTTTDVLFRGPALTGGWTMTLILSLLWYNFGSEFALVQGPRYALYGISLMRENLAAFLVTVGRPASMKRKKGKKGGAEPSRGGAPMPPPAGAKPTPRGGAKPTPRGGAKPSRGGAPMPPPAGAGRPPLDSMPDLNSRAHR